MTDDVAAGDLPKGSGCLPSQSNTKWPHVPLQA